MANEYALSGDGKFFAQVAPEASFWSELPTLSVVGVGEVERQLGGVCRLPEYPPEGSAEYRKEVDELRQYQQDRETSFVDLKYPLSAFLTHEMFAQRPPAGAMLSDRVTGHHQGPIVTNGVELASLFETEKVAVWHQHVLLTLMDTPGEVRDPASGDTIVLRLREVIPPPRQALMQAALHLAVYSALTAAWRFKWRDTDGHRIERRPRPYEALKGGKPPFTVLYDHPAIVKDGKVTRDETKPNNGPPDGPGTPRHPAYGSGHSTYSKAASQVLKLFLPDDWGTGDKRITGIHGHLDLLATNIGEARLWAGVHWRQDHVFGQLVGEAVAERIRAQLNRSLVNAEMSPPPGPHPDPVDDPSVPPQWLGAPPTRPDLERLFAATAKRPPANWEFPKPGDPASRPKTFRAAQKS